MTSPSSAFPAENPTPNSEISQTHNPARLREFSDNGSSDLPKQDGAVSVTDPLTTILDGIRVGGSFAGWLPLSEAAGVTAEAGTARFYVLWQGDCWFQTGAEPPIRLGAGEDRKSTRLNSSHVEIS